MWTDILILGELARGPQHGYGIKQRVGQSIGHTTPINNNVLYPALRRLEELGAVQSELVPQAASPPRRVYQLTERGEELLRGMVEDFPDELALSDGEFNVRVGYLHLVDPAARVAILQTRAAAERRLLEHLRRSLREMREQEQPSIRLRLVEFLIQQTEASVRFCEDLSQEQTESER